MITKTRNENACLSHALFEEIEEWIAASLSRRPDHDG
jgi:hypothetical protein